MSNRRRSGININKINLKNRIVSGISGKYRLLPVILALIIIWIIFALIRPAFLSPRNISNLFIQITNTAIIALGLFFVLVLGELDLSVAYQGAVSATVVATMTVLRGWHIIPGILIGLLCGCLVGLIQGFVVTKFGAPAFIITLGSQLILNGVLLLILPQEKSISLVGRAVSMITTEHVHPLISYSIVVLTAIIHFLLAHFTYLQAKKFELAGKYFKEVIQGPMLLLIAGLMVVFFFNLYKGVNIVVLILFVLLSVFHYVFTQTKFGTYLFAIGGNPEAARRSGINVKRMKLYAFIISGAIIALGGIVASSRVQGVSAASGDADSMMNAIAAAVLGGTSLSGGRGSIWGLLIGSLVMGSISNGMYLVGADTSVRLIVQGIILALAIIMDSIVSKAGKIRR